MYLQVAIIFEESSSEIFENKKAGSRVKIKGADVSARLICLEEKLLAGEEMCARFFSQRISRMNKSVKTILNDTLVFTEGAWFVFLNMLVEPFFELL